MKRSECCNAPIETVAEVYIRDAFWSHYCREDTVPKEVIDTRVYRHMCSECKKYLDIKEG